MFGRDLTPSEAVDEIIAAVRNDGDAGLRRFERELGGNRRESLLIQPEEFEEADRLVSAGGTSKQWKLAVYRVWRFHERHRPNSWMDFDETGTLGQIVRPLERIALYAPGGRASYPSTVIHLGVPARVAGVGEIVMASPADANGKVAPGVLVASRLAGVDRVYAMGGAQAIAALAYGTESRAGGRQDRRAGEHLRGAGEAEAVRGGWNRSDRRPDGDGDHCGRDCPAGDCCD